MSFLLVLILSIFSFAEEAKSGGISVASTQYSLDRLEPVSVSVYSTSSPTVRRHYLQFRNHEGNHFIVYEEESSLPPVKEVHDLKKFAENLNAVCALELDCPVKPFCTGRCANMYYQIANMSSIGASDGRNKCKIQSFTCSRSSEVVVSQGN